jgi:hypothetical protein
LPRVLGAAVFGVDLELLSRYPPSPWGLVESSR